MCLQNLELVFVVIFPVFVVCHKQYTLNCLFSDADAWSLFITTPSSYCESPFCCVLSFLVAATFFP